MTEELQKIFAELKNDVVWVHGRWKIFNQLFRHSKETIALLNTSGSTFFFVIQNLLIEEACLGISRLTDRALMGADQNLTVGQLIVKLDKKEHKGLHNSLVEKLDELKNQAKALRDLRNKKIAHRDFRVQMNAEESPLEPVSLEVIERSLKDLRDFMNTFELYFTNSQTAYEHFSMKEDGRTLVAKLLKAKAYEELEGCGVIEHGYWRSARPEDA